MKIGVFGDSYADKSGLRADNTSFWYNFLEKNHAHEIDCFGESGSSILFSADLIEKNASNYDLVIWCLTTPGRFSLPHVINGRNVHVTTSWDKCKSTDIEILKKHSVCVDYLKYIFDWNTENFVSKSVVSYMQSQHKNIMIIPCFPPPLSSNFNLYTLCEIEANFYFPGKTIPEIYKTHNDLRSGHITKENQKILADLINQDLRPGIFQTSYSNFIKPTQPLNMVFQLK
jgi:hypothetical protein